MLKTTTYTWIVLILLTIVSAILSGMQGPYVVLMILGLAVLKFIGVGYEFMDLKKAHWAWTVGLFGFLVIFTVMVVLMLE